MLASFSGTNGDDIYVIDFEGDRPVSIEINGETFDNPDATMELEFHAGNDQISLTGGDGHYIESSYVDSRQSLNVNETLSIKEGENPGSATLVLRTGDGNDTVDSSSYFDVRYETEGGNDVVEISDRDVDLGPGDDTAVQTSNSVWDSTLTGGEGFDTVQGLESFRFRDENVVQEVTFSTLPGNSFTRTRHYFDFEKFTTPGNENLRIFSEHEILINGTSSWVLNPAMDLPWEVENATVYAPGETTAVYVHETSEPIQIRGGYVNLGGDFNNGDTSGIQHVVTLDAPNSAIISNSGSDEPQNVVVDGDFRDRTMEISGLTPELLYVTSSDRANVNLAGSNTAGDRFQILANNSHLVLFGNGGDDQIVTKPHFHEVAGGMIKVVGGEGTDLLEVDDRNSSSTPHYVLNENWIFAPNIHSTYPNTDFSGVYHDGVEKSHLIGSHITDRFYITPSTQTQYTITGGKLNQVFANVFNLIEPYQGTYQFADLGDNRYTWLFGEEGANFVHFRYGSPSEYGN